MEVTPAGHVQELEVVKGMVAPACEKPVRLVNTSSSVKTIDLSDLSL